MENITHSLVGATLAELALPPNAGRGQRRLFVVAGIVAANLPDADLIYTRITPPPLGYLLHHRGHTHTVAGVVAQVLLMVAVCLLPGIARHAGIARARLWALIATSLLSHLVLDSWNSYGVHPFWPFDVRWYYGDAIYIAEPWLWGFLGVAAAMNAQSGRGRLAMGAGLGALAGALVWFGIVGIGALAAIVLVAATMTLLLRSCVPRVRSGVALVLTALFVTSAFAVRREVHASVHASVLATLAAVAPPARGEVLDVVLSPRIANPLCWSALAIVKHEETGEYVTTRGTAAASGRIGCGPSGTTGVEWEASTRHSLAALRELERSDCSVRAWLQFARAPEVGEGAVGDLRYGGAAGENFSRMRVSPAGRGAACPPNLTGWGRPREDLLRRH